MSLIIDHIFCFCDPTLPELKLLEDNGFVVFPGIIHEGQGTANRAVIFESTYFELIYLNSKEQALANPLKMDLRADWKHSGASPFGIALRGDIPESDLENFWDYIPTYSPNIKIKMHRFSHERPDFPLLFVMPSPATSNSEKYRIKYFKPHQSASTQISKVNIKAPFTEWPLSTKVEGLHFEKNSSPSMEIETDGNLSSIIQLNEILTLKIIKCYGSSL